MKAYSHLEHFEDIIINEGREGLNKVLELLSDINNEKTILLNEKIDGAAAIYFGLDDKKEYFISTKKILRKEPILFKSKKQIREEYSDNLDLVSMLEYCFDNLYKIVDGSGVWMGDLLFTPKIKKEITIENKKAISFKPNTITYIVVEGEKNYNEIKEANVGLEIHASYTFKNNELMIKSYDGKGLKKDKDVFWVDSAIHESISLNIDLDVVKNKLNDFSRGIGNELWDLLENNPIKGILKKYNVEVGKGIINNPTDPTSFYKWVEEGDFSQKSKNLILEVDQENIHALLQAINYLVDVKNKILGYLNTAKGSKVAKSYYDGKEIPVEGYIINTENGIIKLVDREGFTKLNQLEHGVK